MKEIEPRAFMIVKDCNDECLYTDKLEREKREREGYRKVEFRTVTGKVSKSSQIEEVQVRTRVTEG